MLIQMVPNLRIVVLESPYDTLSDPLVRDLFSKAMQLKIEGYRLVYPYGVLPVDTYDFIATHQLICREEDGSFQVLMGAKYITLKKCQTHSLPFPGLSLLRAANALTHEQVLSELLKSYSEEPEKVSYGSSWAIGSEARANPVLKKYLKDLMTVTLLRYEMELRTTERLCCGVPKVKTDLYFQSLGYEKLQFQGHPLPPFNQASLLGEPAVMLHCTAFSDAAIELSEHYNSLWDSRLVINNLNTSTVPSKEAA